MDLPTMRTRVRDEDSTNERWSDSEIVRHIARAVQELSLAAPVEAAVTLQTVADSRDLNVAALVDRVSIDAVEYPTGEYPASFVEHSLWGETLSLLVDGVPAAATARATEAAESARLAELQAAP
jgi:hypothetical protein